MFRKILIANRGEIAVRVIRACRELGILTTAVYSEMDKDSMHVKLADEAICIGPASIKESYLNAENIISATILTNAEAIHPGYGFLSENARFAEMCKVCGITFIGPDRNMIERMGDKSEARSTMTEASVPVVPGSDGVVSDSEIGIRTAEAIGFPVIVKARAGGGGKGMRIIRNRREFVNNFLNAQREAENAFGDGSVYIEKYIENPRHIEFQIMGDKHGNVIHLYERDCSIQRRHQKIIEESPSASLSDELRKKMGEMAVKAAKVIHYDSVGTVEFLLDKNDNYYFVEMNTRIQVEHTVTEMVTQMDLIKEQIRIAAGEVMPYRQEDIRLTGHAVECRINAEDPYNGFMPSPGHITSLHFPGGNGVRVDSALYGGYTILPNYDSMAAKLVCKGSTRQEAIAKLGSALGETEVEGIKTNIKFLQEIINKQAFIDGRLTTHFINDEFGFS